MTSVNTGKARALRRSQTDAERKLWAKLRSRRLNGVKFRRQYPVGKYILDFFCPEYRIGIELDGGQHYEAKGKAYDAVRKSVLENEDIEILRFSNIEALNKTNEVCMAINEEIQKRERTLTLPSPSKGEGKTL